MRKFYFILLILGFIMFVPALAQAIPPPDLIINIGSQVAQIFALLVVLFSAAAGLIAQYFRMIFLKVKAKKLVVGLSAIVILATSLVVAVYIEQGRIEEAQRDFEAEVASSIQAGIEENTLMENKTIDTQSTFFVDHQDLPMAISNTDFALLEDSHPFILDAREDEEYALGHYPDSIHLRFADVLAGSWTQLPTNQVVYVFCWSGIRGSEVTKFLRDHGVVAQYLEDGAKGWVDAGGTWQGEILFSTKYSDVRYTGTLTTEEVKSEVTNGTILVDARQKKIFDQSHLPGSINISIFFTPSVELETLLNQVPVSSKVITICDDFVSCFDAKIAGVKLEKLGHTFLGRYSTPWDY